VTNFAVWARPSMPRHVERSVTSFMSARRFAIVRVQANVPVAMPASAGTSTRVSPEFCNASSCAQLFRRRRSISDCMTCEAKV
jgi:hypothetical protein